MSLFGYTSYYPTNIDESKWSKTGQGYNVNKVEHEMFMLRLKINFKNYINH